MEDPVGLAGELVSPGLEAPPGQGRDEGRHQPRHAPRLQDLFKKLVKYLFILPTESVRTERRRRSPPVDLAARGLAWLAGNN